MYTQFGKTFMIAVSWPRFLYESGDLTQDLFFPFSLLLQSQIWPDQFQFLFWSLDGLV